MMRRIPSGLLRFGQVLALLLAAQALVVVAVFAATQVAVHVTLPVEVTQQIGILGLWGLVVVILALLAVVVWERELVERARDAALLRYVEADAARGTSSMLVRDCESYDALARDVWEGAR